MREKKIELKYNIIRGPASGARLAQNDNAKKKSEKVNEKKV